MVYLIFAAQNFKSLSLYDVMVQQTFCVKGAMSERASSNSILYLLLVCI